MKIICLRISIPKVCGNPNNIQLRVQTFFYKIAFLLWIVPNLWLNFKKNWLLVTKYPVHKQVFQSAKQSSDLDLWWQDLSREKYYALYQAFRENQRGDCLHSHLHIIQLNIHAGNQTYKGLVGGRNLCV